MQAILTKNNYKPHHKFGYVGEIHTTQMKAYHMWRLPKPWRDKISVVYDSLSIIYHLCLNLTLEARAQILLMDFDISL